MHQGTINCAILGSGIGGSGDPSRTQFVDRQGESGLLCAHLIYFGHNYRNGLVHFYGPLQLQSNLKGCSDNQPSMLPFN